MLRFLQGPLLGIIALLLFIINTIFWVFYFFIIAIFKLIIPIKSFRLGCTRVLSDIASTWMSCNTFMLNLFIKIDWQIISDVDLDINNWYLVICNHQSWTDIVVLMQVLNRRIPLLKFFLKKELIYIPLLGFTWWALDYPFMKRYSKSMIRKNPKLKGKDLETTKKACENFKLMPNSVMNFVEGTRFTPEKRRQHNSSFKHLLAPKAGGIAYTLQAMGKHLNEIIDVTIIYPTGSNSMWDLLTGRIDRVKIYLRKLPITPNLIGDYQNDKQFRIDFQQWLNHVWHEKDAILAQELQHG